MRRHLLTPGPVELSHDVILAGAKQLIGHRTAEFSDLLKNLEVKLAKLLKSEGPVVILPSSGTGALECLIFNFLDKGDKFLSVSCGNFGSRFRKIGEQVGAEAVCLDISLGSSPDPDVVVDFVKQNPECKVLLLTQNETSTGVLVPIKEIIYALPKENRPIILVDGVSSVGAMECYPEEWGVDGLATASQKGLLTPPGLGLVWLSKKAWDFIEKRKCISHYFDLKLHKKRLISDIPDNPYTPPVSLFYALDEALDFILNNDKEKWFKSRIKYARAFAAGIEALGLELLVPNSNYRSPGLTAFSSKTLDSEKIRKYLKEIGIETAGGLGSLKGNLIRVAHYNDCNWPELSMILGSLYAALVALGEKPNSDFITKALNEWNKEK